MTYILIENIFYYENMKFRGEEMILNQKTEEIIPGNVFFGLKTSEGMFIRKWAKSFCREHRDICLAEVLSLFRLFTADFYLKKKKKSWTCWNFDGRAMKNGSVFEKTGRKGRKFFISDGKENSAPAEYEEKLNFPDSLFNRENGKKVPFFYLKSGFSDQFCFQAGIGEKRGVFCKKIKKEEENDFGDVPFSYEGSVLLKKEYAHETSGCFAGKAPGLKNNIPAIKPIFLNKEPAFFEERADKPEDFRPKDLEKRKTADFQKENCFLKNTLAKQPDFFFFSPSFFREFVDFIEQHRNKK